MCNIQINSTKPVRVSIGSNIFEGTISSIEVDTDSFFDRSTNSTFISCKKTTVSILGFDGSSYDISTLEPVYISEIL